MNAVLSLSPLLRQSVGFERFNDLFESASRVNESTNSYPPYNIEKRGEENYAITMVVAGFSVDDLSIMVQNGKLTIKGYIEDKEDQHVEYLYRGIANPSFEHSFSLADHMMVTDATIKDGVLSISLVREIPEEAKPRIIHIKNVNGKILGAANTFEPNIKKESK